MLCAASLAVPLDEAVLQLEITLPEAEGEIDITVVLVVGVRVTLVGLPGGKTWLSSMYIIKTWFFIYA